MYKALILTIVLAVAAPFGVRPSQAQSTKVLPTFVSLSVNIRDDNGIPKYAYNFNFEDAIPDNLVFGNTPGALILEDYQISITITVADTDWAKAGTNGDPPSLDPTNVKLFQRRNAIGITTGAPTPPPFDDEQNSATFRTVPISQSPVLDTSTGTPRGLLTWSYYTIRVPEFNGANQLRLQRRQVFDVGWDVTIEISPDESPGEDVIPPRLDLLIFATENPGLRPGDPPPFADAGRSTAIPRNLTDNSAVGVLDARATFDASNVGFNPADSAVLDKNYISYAWEIISAPVDWVPNYTVAPFEDGTARALVTLNDVRTGDAFEFRVLARDGVNPTPSSSSVRVTIIDPPPANATPVANAGPDLTVAVGGTIRLDGSRSTDADAADQGKLTYLWRQTNAVGGPLAPAQLATAFQPVSGVSSAISTWRAVAVGTYYFRLIVVDPSGASSFDDVSVVVSDSGTGGTARETTGSADTTLQPNVGGLCGAGLAPVALVPLLLLPRRGRMR